VNWVNLGLMDYQVAWDVQRQIAELRAHDALGDTLLFVQHPHTYTLGRSGHVENLLMSETERRRLRIAVIDSDRGGDITYHGPGQLVIYPILSLGALQPDGHLPRADYVGYIRRLEQTIIDTLGHWGIDARSEGGLTGAWVDTPAGPEKIAAIGVKVTAGGVSMHGLALNVDPDLRFFSGIIPCGIADKGVTSMAKLLGEGCPSIDAVAARFRSVFESRFLSQLHEVLLADLHLPVQ
jgi:lipoyl(octanoyl) transferase